MPLGTFKRRLRQVILWVVALQLGSWIATATIFFWLNQRQESDRSSRPLTSAALPWNNLQHPLNLPLGKDEQVLRLTLLESPLGPIYRLILDNGQERIFNALSGQAFSPLGPLLVLKMAQEHYKGRWPGGELNFLVQNPPGEYQGPLPVYQLQIFDSENTTFYIDPYEGLILQRRDVFWRIYENLNALQAFNLTLIRDYWALSVAFSCLILLFLLWQRFHHHHPMEN